ncbi:MAG: hypothetical protein LC799_19265 [Actinobacteria bacterium]|nr:hypothetical protein [Actinomycetota bacterium]
MKRRIKQVARHPALRCGLLARILVVHDEHRVSGGLRVSPDEPLDAEMPWAAVWRRAFAGMIRG